MVRAEIVGSSAFSAHGSGASVNGPAILSSGATSSNGKTQSAGRFLRCSKLHQLHARQRCADLLREVVKFESLLSLDLHSALLETVIAGGHRLGWRLRCLHLKSAISKKTDSCPAHSPCASTTRCAPRFSHMP